MKLIVHGQQAFGQSVLEAIVECGKDEVVAAYCAPDNGSRVDPLKQCATNLGVPVYQPASYKDPLVWDQMRSHQADLCVMAYVTLFVPEEALNIPRLGSIQYHPSLLPMHKGPSSINWPIIFGERQTGLSIFWPDNGLDTGPILLQKEVAIGPDDTLGSLYFNHLFPMGVSTMLEAIDRVRDGSAPKVSQDPSKGSYEGWCRKDDARIDWSNAVAEVYNLIRGTNPQPGAWTTIDGERLAIFDCRPSGKSGGSPGEVVAVSSDGFSIAAVDGRIDIERVRLEGHDKIGAAEFARIRDLSEGTILGTDSL